MLGKKFKEYITKNVKFCKTSQVLKERGSIDEQTKCVLQQLFYGCLEYNLRHCEQLFRDLLLFIVTNYGLVCDFTYTTDCS